MLESVRWTLGVNVSETSYSDSDEDTRVKPSGGFRCGFGSSVGPTEPGSAEGVVAHNTTRHPCPITWVVYPGERKPRI